MVKNEVKVDEVTPEEKARLTALKNSLAYFEELCKFCFFAEHKDSSRRELCGGLITKTVTMNGESYFIVTSLTEAEVTRYREGNCFDLI